VAPEGTGGAASGEWWRPGGWPWLVALAFALAAGLGCSKSPEGDGDTGAPRPDGREGPRCEFDEIGEAGEAASLEVGEQKNGHICPIQDEDWYAFSLSEARRIVDVSVGFSTGLTSVQPAYKIWTATDDGGTDEVVGSSPSTEDATQITRQHCLDQGDYRLVVYDRGYDDEDRRRPYAVSLDSTDNPDGQEPNEDRDGAVSLQSGDSKEGYIACRGDQDWYSIEVPDGNVLQFELNSAEVDYVPQVEVLGESGDETVYASAANEQAGGGETAIKRFAVVPEGGTYYLNVSDKTGENADASEPYTLSVEVRSDTDPNEPNDNAEESTELTGGGSASCGSSWGQTYETVGTIGGEKDQDWFRLPLQGCENGVVDADVELQGGGSQELNEKLQLRLRMVRPHAPTSCSSNDDCDVLEAECDRGLDCRAMGGVCNQERAYCTGGIDQCLPSGSCGAIQVQREFPCPPDRAPYRDECGSGELANRAAIGAPLPETDAVYFQVSDIGFDGAAPDAPYSLRVRVQQETDANEPNNVYIGNDALFDNHAEEVNHDRANEVPVHDCTPQTTSSHGDGGSGDSGGMSSDSGGGGTADSGGGTRQCCQAGAEWTTGAISYDNDIDRFKYQHPCPGGDCVMNFHYEIDAGPVDHLFNVLRGGRAGWYSLVTQCEQGSHQQAGPTVSGAKVQSGGEPNLCFYAYEGHGSEDDPYTYGLKIGDKTDEFSDNAFKPQGRDWDPNQSYRFCIEKVAEGCPGPPCDKAENGQCDGGGGPNQHCDK